MTVGLVSNVYDPIAHYCEGLNAATLEELTAHVTHYAKLFPDAMRDLPKNEEEFKVFQEGIAKERKKVWAGEHFQERYGNLVMPDVAVFVATFSDKYHIPWGLALNRCLETGYVRVDSQGRYQVVKH